MRNLILFILILFVFIMCSSTQNKFIGLQDVMNKKNENIHYDVSDYHLLEQYDSLYAYYEHYDSLHIEHREIILTKKYKTIETLINNLDENLLAYFNDIFGIEFKVDFKDTLVSEAEHKINFPVLKYKNRVFVTISAPYSAHSFIIDLKEPQKVTIIFIEMFHDTPNFILRPITKEDSTYVTVFPAGVVL